MAIRFHLLPESPLRFHQYRFCKFLCSDVQHSPEIGYKTADEYVGKFSIFLALGRTDDARRLVQSLLHQPDSPFTSPADLFSFFCRRGERSFRTAFSDTLLSVCAESTLPEEAVVELYTSIIKEGFFPSLSSLNLLLQSLVSSGKYAKALHFFTDVIDSGIRVGNFTYSKAVESAVRLGDLKRGVELMNDMERPNCFVYNVIIDGFCKQKRMDEAKKLFDEMLERKVVADHVTYSVVINGFCKVGNLNRAINVIDKMKAGNVQPDLVTYNTLVDLYCKMKKLNEALTLVEKMKTENMKPNLVTYSTLISGYCKMGKLNEALALVEKMKAENVQPNVVTHSTIVDGYCKMGKLNEALTLVEKMKVENVKPDLVTYNVLIHGYCRMGKLNEALSVLETMKAENVQPGLVTYNTLIDGYCKVGNLTEAFRILEKMKAENVQPSLVTFSSLLGGLSRSIKIEDARKLLQEAKQIFDDLKSRALIPGADTYIKLIKGHCNINDFDGGYAWYRKMLENGFLPDNTTCNDLVTGLGKLGRLQEIEIICSEVSISKVVKK